MTFGDWIDADKGRTYRAVGLLCGISHPTIARYAKGTRTPAYNTACSISEKLGWDQETHLVIFSTWAKSKLQECEKWKSYGNIEE